MLPEWRFDEAWKARCEGHEAPSHALLVRFGREVERMALLSLMVYSRSEWKGEVPAAKLKRRIQRIVWEQRKERWRLGHEERWEEREKRRKAGMETWR